MTRFISTAPKRFTFHFKYQPSTSAKKVAQMRLKKKGFDVSIGSACANKQGSQAVYRLYHQAKLAQTSIRISLSPYHSPHDILLLSQAIKEVLR